MGKFICEYCDGSFIKRGNLYKHQRTAKYCLEMQNRIVKNAHICKYCEREYSRSDNLKRHEKDCQGRIVYEKMQDKQNDHLLNMITELQKTIATMSQVKEDRIGTINNNNRQMVMGNVQPLTEEDLQEHLQHLSIDYIQEGGKGYANFAGCYPFKDRLVCTDKSRKKLRYKDSEGDMIEDGGGTKLTQRFFQAISERNEELINTEYDSLQQRVAEIAQQGTAHCTDLSSLLTKATKLQQLLISCREAAEGKENDLTKEFVNHLTKML